MGPMGKENVYRKKMNAVVLFPLFKEKLRAISMFKSLFVQQFEWGGTKLEWVGALR